MDLRLGFYGDDFTGSTDALEALSTAGLRTVLFIEPPTAEQLARFPGLEAVGVAGRTRSLATGDISAELRPVFARFAELGCPLVHYKTCSTFDSSPEVGSIGRAIDVGQEIFASPFVPLVVGAPVLQRFCVFGNLFARSGLDSEIFRLDRHPTMRQHPVTPMHEADLRLHLGRQTERQIGLFDVQALALSQREREVALDALLAEGAEIVLFDVLTDEHLQRIGQLLSTRAEPGKTLFVAGSSGIEYALCQYWGVGNSQLPAGGAAVDHALVVSGSCSPVTERQIARALTKGFAGVAADTALLVQGGPAAEAETARLVVESLKALEAGKSPLVHTALGPADERIGATAAKLQAMGYDLLDLKLKSGEIFGRVLGNIVQTIFAGTGLRRACVAGGDTSTYAARQLRIEALEMVGPMAPGSPLCRVSAANGVIDGAEITFKGGQVGRDDFFTSVLKGKP
ncbi:MAG: four-carbon acid sugar kinase family protein [Gemmatimonadetes bacterium]|nr:four-carbon acid sugar kinase family protein [Gemmatimonadota bacterium]MBT5451367.1 four-carbon acid sugar kinase family protein [Gemmatimonadota bacterium]MBT7585428.1 four-carbon acid sugar kinase family protein [Gemmatimonadota bacterium]